MLGAIKSLTKSFLGTKKKSIGNLNMWLGDDSTFLKNINPISYYLGSSPWVSVCVDSIVRDISSQDIFFTDKNARVIDIARVPDNVKMPILGNGSATSLNELLKFAVGQLLLFGNAYLLKTINTAWGASKNAYDSLTPIESGFVTPVFNETKTGIVSYKVNKNGAIYTYEAQDIIHIKQSNVSSPLVGIGNIEKLTAAIDGDVLSSEYINSFLSDSSLMPSTWILDQNKMLPEDMARLEQKFKKVFSKRIGYLNGTMEVKQESLLQKDLQFIEMRDQVRQTILSVFGIPPIIAGIPDNSNRASANTQFAIYYKNAVNPRIKDIESAINDQFLRDINQNIIFRIKRHPEGDVANVVEMLRNGIVTQNRAAEMLGEAFDLSDESRNEYFIQSSYIPSSIDMQAEQAKKKVYDRLNDPKNVALIVDYFVKSAKPAKTFQAKYLYSALKSRNYVEDKYTQRIEDYFRGLEVRVLEKLAQLTPKSTKVAVSYLLDANDLFSKDEEIKAIETTLRPLYTSGVQKAVVDINTIVGASVNFNLTNPIIASMISKIGSKISGLICKTTITDLQNIVVDAIQNSWDIIKLQDEIQTKFKEFSGVRSRLISRTESARAWDAGASVSMKELGVKMIDVVGCTQFEPDSDCGKMNIPIDKALSLNFHPNHKGCIAPSIEI